MTIPVTSLDFQSNSRAVNLLNPANPQDAATKIYVDNSITNINNGMIVVNEFNTLTTSTGNWVLNDILVRFQITTNAGAITSTIWYNNAGTQLATIPIIGTDVEAIDKSELASIKSIATNQTSGTQKAINRGAAKGTTVAGDVTSTTQSADRQALDVQIRNSIGAAINTFPTTFSADNQDIYNHLIIGQRILQLNLAFFGVPPNSLLNITASGGAAATQGSGSAVFSSSTATTSSIKAVTPLTLNYTPQYELFASYSAIFTAPTSAASMQRLGAYSNSDGFSYGYSGLTFGLWSRFNAVDTFVAQVNWNVDTCQGGVSSAYTRNGVPEVLDPTKTNIYRVRFGWHGAAPLVFEVLNPDGQYIRVHTIRPANNMTTPSMISPNVPITLEITKSASDATNLVVTCPAWSGGTSAPTSSSFTGYGLLSAAGTAVLMPTAGVLGLAIAISGTWTGTLIFQVTVDGINWINDSTYSTVNGGFASSITANGTFETNVGSYRGYRVYATTLTSGMAVIAYSAGAGSAITTTQAFVTDPTNNNTISIKAASTSAVATDSAIVVIPSPNGNHATATNQATEISSLSTIANNTTTSATAARKTTFTGATYSGTGGNLNILDATGAGAATDVRGLNSGVLFTFPNGVTTPFMIEGSMTSTAGGTWTNIDSYESNNNMYVGFKTPSTALALVRTYIPLQDYNYIRVQYSAAAVAGGTSTLVASAQPFAPPKETARTTFGASTFVDDITQSTITASQNQTFTPSKGSSYSVFVPVSAISGSGAAMMVQVQESLDSGSNWRTIYTFAPITGTGIYTSPLLPLCGDTIRYVQVVTGTSPSITRSISRVESNATAALSIAPRRLGGFNAANGVFDLAAQGRVRRIVANNRTATQLYLQVHDSTTALATGAVPSAGEVYQLNTNAMVVLNELGEFGTTLGTNPRIAISSTYATYTPPPSLAANTVSLFVETL